MIKTSREVEMVFFNLRNVESTVFTASSRRVSVNR